MNKLLKYLCLVLAIVCVVAFGGHAQKYNTLIGIRAGDDLGFTATQRIANKITLSLNHQPGSFAGKEMTTLMIRSHYSLLTKRLNVYLGGGGYTRKYHPLEWESTSSNRVNGLGFDIGAELTIGRLSLSTDFQPLVVFSRNETNRRFYSTNGISLRYVLVKRDSKFNKFWRKIF